MLVHRLRQWIIIEPARYTIYTGVQLALAKEEKHETPVNPCSAIELKLAQRPNKPRPTSRTQPRTHDASKQCCFKADPPSTTLAQPQNNTGSTHQATGIILKYSQQIQDSETTMAQCRANAANGALALPHRRITTPFLL